MNIFAVVRSSGKRIHVDECMEKKCMSYSKGTFSCIDCANAVYPRRGEKRAWHFSHYSSKQNQACPHRNGGETVEHYKSKHWIANNVAQIRFRIACCPKCFRSTYLQRSCGSYCMSAEVEKRIPGTNRIADVLLVERSVATGYTKVLAAVEVFHTHEVDGDKMAECRRAGVRILEVASDNVVQNMQRHGELCDSRVTLSARHVVSEICDSCAMYECFLGDLHSQLCAGLHYDAEWMRFCNALCRARCIALKGRQEADGLLAQKRRAVEDEMHLAYTKETANVLAYDSWYESIWRQHGMQKCRELRQQNQRNREMQLAAAKKRKAAEEAKRHADTKRAALGEVRSRALDLKERSLKRQAMLRDMQEMSIANGGGTWSTATYWQNFHAVTLLVFGDLQP